MRLSSRPAARREKNYWYKRTTWCPTPNVSEEALRAVWAAIEAGWPWLALVMGRRKNGNHYWVRANATPIRRDAQIVGYLSVCTAAAEHVAAAERLYAGHA